MTKKFKHSHIFLLIATLILASLACGSLQIGIVTTPDNAANRVADEQTQLPEGIAPIEETLTPVAEPEEDFSYLWTEYRDPAYGYGVALPAHWQVNPTPTEGYDGAMTTASYDEAYFMAHSIKGWWTDNVIPEGVVKMDFAGIPDEYPELDLAGSLKEIYNRQSDITVVLSIDPVVYNGHQAVLVTTANPNNLDETYKTVAFRLSNDKLLLVTAFWGDVFSSPDVQAILNSFAFEGEPVNLPKIAPHPPLSASPTEDENTRSESQRAVAWLGHIYGLPEGGKYDDFVLLSPPGVGEFGIRGSTPEIESEIRFLRDKEGSDEYVHLWGQYSCGVDDYNNCQLIVDQIHRDGYIEDYAEGWEGIITAHTFNGAVSHVFQLSGDVPMWYSLHASQDAAMQAQIESLRDTGAIVQVWGTVMVGVPDVNGTRIEPTRLEVIQAGGAQAPLPSLDPAPGWQIYTNDRFGYRLQYPDKAEIVEHGPDGGVPTDEIPIGMTVDLYQEYLRKVYPQLCVEILFGQGYVNISAPPNAGGRYTPCGITGVGSGEITAKTEEVWFDGQLISAEGMEFIGSDALQNHFEEFRIELQDGTRIRFGGGSTSGGTYEDYLMNTKDVLLKILASYHPMVKRDYLAEAGVSGTRSSSATCDSGYLGTAEEMIEALQSNLIIGNYYPFSYMMGNPFVIGYWRSEGLSLSREEAFAQLQADYFPSPDQVTITSDTALFPSLDGMPLDSLWGPEAGIAANLYSTGWGPDGQGETILSIARCSEKGTETYYWYGMLYAMSGFE